MKSFFGYRVGVLLAICFIVTACAAEEVAIAAAADLQFVFVELGQQFQKETGNTVKLTFGSSGNFTNQIENGAPFDMFFSADLNYPKRLQAAALVEPGTLYHYADGKIVLWAPLHSKLDVKRGLQALLDPAVNKIAIANPRHAPYGRAAVAAMRSENVYDKVTDKLILGENISQTAQFVDSGNAEVGIVALSLVVAPAMQGKGSYWVIPQAEYPSIEQGCIILKSARHKQVAQQLLTFIKKPQTSELFKKYGFVIPPAAQ